MRVDDIQSLEDQGHQFIDGSCKVPTYIGGEMLKVFNGKFGIARNDVMNFVEGKKKTKNLKMKQLKKW